MKKEKQIFLEIKNYNIKEISCLIDRPPVFIIKFFFLLGYDINYYSDIDYLNLKELLDFYKINYIFVEKDDNLNINVIDNIDIKKEQKKVPTIIILGQVDNGKTHFISNLLNKNLLKKEKGYITQDLNFFKININNNYFFFIDTPGHNDFNIIKNELFSITNLFIIVISIENNISDYIIKILKFLTKNNLLFMVIFTFVDEINNKTINLIKKRIFDFEVLGINININEKFLYNEGDIEAILISNKNLYNINSFKTKINLLKDIIDLSVKKYEISKIKVLSMYYENKKVISIVFLYDNIKLNDLVIDENGFLLGEIKEILTLDGLKLKKANCIDNCIVKVIGLYINKVILYKIYSLSNKNKKTFKIHNGNIYKKKMIINKNLSNFIIKVNKKEDIEVILNITSKHRTINVIYIDCLDINDDDIIIANQSNSKLIYYKKKVDFRAINKAKVNKIDIYDFDIIYKFIDFLDSKKLKESIDNYNNLAKVIQIFKIKKTTLVFGCNLIKGEFQTRQKVSVIRNKKIILKGLIIKSLKIEDDIKLKVDKINCNFGIIFDSKDNLESIKLQDTIV